MNKRTWLLGIALLSLLFSQSNLLSQEGWYRVGNAYRQSDFQSIYFLANGQTGWAVGSNGVIIHTNNAGNSWVSQNNNIQYSLNNWLTDAFFVNDLEGWVAGSIDGRILHTSNGGTSWSFQSYNWSDPLCCVYFIDNRNGWAAGTWGLIAHSSDGGATWEGKRFGSGARDFYDIYFSDYHNGWIVGDGPIVIHTSDGGVTWARQTIPPSSDDLYGLSFIDASRGWAVGRNGVIIHTSDGGETWTRQAGGTNRTLFSVSFIDGFRGWAVGEKGTIIQTQDGGASWRAQKSSTNKNLKGVFFIENGYGWAVGDSGIVMKYTPPKLAINDNISSHDRTISIGFIAIGSDSSIKLAILLKNIGSAPFTVQKYQSSNSALTLAKHSLPRSLNPNEQQIFTIIFSPKTTGLYQDSLSFFISGQDTSTVYTIKVSGGALVSDDPLLRSLYQRAVAAYDSCKVYDSNSPATHNNLGVILAMLNATEEAAAELSYSSENGTKLNRGTVNAIQKKYQQALSIWSDLAAEARIPATIKPQLNFNLAWVYDEIDSLERAYEYYTYVIGDSLANRRLVAKAYLGRGVTVFKMSRDSSAANENFRQALALDPHGAGVLAQQNMQAILTGVAPGGLVTMPQTFALEQNYPNPFNPHTTIRYQLPRSSKVRLEIYDVLGHRVRTLVDESQPPGCYSLQWDGKDEDGRQVASNIYFYSLKAGKISIRRKMVLMR